MKNNELIRGEQLSFSFQQQPILQNVSIAVRAGEIVTLIGPNGAGKTTLVRIMLGLLKPDQGQVHRSKALRLGYMPQKLSIDPNLPLSVERFLLLACKDKKRITETLKETGIEKLRQSPLTRISGGEMQRVLLARALLREPQLLVLDEPVQGVDIAGQTELYQLIGEIRNRYNCGVLMVSHDLHLVMSATDTVVCLNQHICCQGHPEAVSNDPEYLTLFGEQHAKSLALYAHNHDHNHDLHGNVVNSQKTDHQACGHEHNKNEEQQSRLNQNRAGE